MSMGAFNAGRVGESRERLDLGLSATFVPLLCLPLLRVRDLFRGRLSGVVGLAYFSGVVVFGALPLFGVG